jgi:hypothetical protein
MDDSQAHLTAMNAADMRVNTPIVISKSIIKSNKLVEPSGGSAENQSGSG